MFQLPFGGFIPAFGVDSQFTDTVKFESKDTLRRHFKMSGLKKSVIRNMELLVIDEEYVADLLDAMDYMMQTVRKNTNPFGGVQVLFIGDLLQLPPVIEMRNGVRRNYYKGKFFPFACRTAKSALYIELSTIYRQTDTEFISVLNNLRNNQITAADVQALNKYVPILI
jgi:hypothetical protein